MTRPGLRDLRLGAVLLATLGAPNAWAQGTPPAKLEDLRSPSSPAFVLMGIEPKSIEHPKTPRAFVLSAVQAARDASGLPKNYAMEFAPFWLVAHPMLKFRPYEKASLGSTFIQTLSLSLATATDSGSAHTSVGLGMRALLARGQMSDSVPILLDSIKVIMGLMLRADDPAKEDRLADLLKVVSLQLQKNLYMKGFRFEIAAAAMGSFDDGKYDTGELSRLGIWVTPSYSMGRKLDVSGVLRLILNRGNRSGSNVDYGLRVSYDIEPLTFSYEIVGRASIDATVTTTSPTAGTFTLHNTYRSAGSLEYKLGAGSSVAFTFGRNFKEGASDNTLIASLSLNLGFGVVPIISKK
jgi:hypothetical protein